MAASRVVDTRIETAAIGAAGAVIVFAAVLAVLIVGGRLERDWLATVEAPTPGRPVAAGGWVSFAPQHEAFRVSLPGPPRQAATGEAADGQSRRRQSFLVEGPTGREHYAVVTATRRDGPKLDRLHPLPDALLDDLVNEASPDGGPIASRRPLVGEEWLGHEVIQERRDRFTRLQVFWSGRTTLVFLVSSPSRADLTGHDAERFFGSVVLTR